MADVYRIFGAELSPYSVKVRSWFRHKGIPHQWIITKCGEPERVPEICQASDRSACRCAAERRYPGFDADNRTPRTAFPRAVDIARLFLSSNAPDVSTRCAHD